jgi:hypothetical protein
MEYKIKHKEKPPFGQMVFPLNLSSQPNPNPE